MKERLESYYEQSNYKLLSKLPIIIHVNGRNFQKTTSLLEKPYCQELSSCFEFVLEKLCMEIEGCFFGYTFNDEFIFLARNDQSKDTQPWYDNKIQKINSVVSSLTTYQFITSINSLDLTILGEPVFCSHVFTAPNTMEVYNYLVLNQNKNFIKSLNFAIEYELLNFGYKRNEIKELLHGLSIEDRKNILLEKADKNYLDYPSQFRRGITSTKSGTKWDINPDIEIFVNDKDNILSLLSKIY